jgi:hypothetical protein
MAGVAVATLVPASPAAASDCIIGNSAPVLLNIFNAIYVENVRTVGSCFPEEEVEPYTCVVFGRAFGGLAVPTDVAGGNSYDPLEHYCEASSNIALSLERCQEWYVLGEFRRLAITIASESSFEFACP